MCNWVVVGIHKINPMLKTTLLLPLIFLRFVGHGQQKDTSDYGIYSILIKNNISASRKSVAIFNVTSRDEYVNPWWSDDTSSRQHLISAWLRIFFTEFDSSSYALYRDFCKKNWKSEKLTKAFQLPIDVFLIKKPSHKKLSRKSAESRWKKFYDKYPESVGIFEFSDVHYSKDRTKAVVYFAVHRNGLNGRGAIVILDKTEGHWKVRHEGNLWMN